MLGLGLFYWTDSRQAWHPVTHLHEIRGQRSHPCERQLFRFSFTFVGATCGVLGTWAATTTVGSVGQIRIAWDRASLLQWTSLLRLSRGCRGQQHVKRSIRQRVKWICFERMLRAAKQNALQRRLGTADSYPNLACAPTYYEVFQAIMAGQTCVETIPHLRELPYAERQTLLCTICSIHDEIAHNCRDHGAEVSKLLASQCKHFIDGRATCLEHSIGPD